MPRSKKEPYDAVYRFRGFSDLGRRIARLLSRDDSDADFMRAAVENYVSEQEEKLGLPPMVVAEEPPAYAFKRKQQPGDALTRAGRLARKVKKSAKKQPKRRAA